MLFILQIIVIISGICRFIIIKGINPKLIDNYQRFTTPPKVSYLFSKYKMYLIGSYFTHINNFPIMRYSYSYISLPFIAIYWWIPEFGFHILTLLTFSTWILPWTKSIPYKHSSIFLMELMYLRYSSVYFSWSKINLIRLY